MSARWPRRPRFPRRQREQTADQGPGEQLARPQPRLRRRRDPSQRRSKRNQPRFLEGDFQIRRLDRHVKRRKTGEHQTRRDRQGTRRQRTHDQQLADPDRQDRPEPARQSQPITAPTIEPNVLVTRSTNEVERLGANNWTTSTDPLKNAPLTTARTRVAPKEAPRPARQIASKNPQGMNKQHVAEHVGPVTRPPRNGCSAQPLQPRLDQFAGRRKIKRQHRA